MRFKCNHCSEGPCFIEVPDGKKIDDDIPCVKDRRTLGYFWKDKCNFTIKHAPPTHQSDKTFDYLTHTQALTDITGSPWDRNSSFSLADVRKKVGQDLVHDPGMPEMIFLPLEVRAAELRAELMAEKIEDIVVTLVCNIFFDQGGSSLRVESVRHSQIKNRIDELKHPAQTTTVKVMMAYSEETKQMFWWNDLMIDEPPRLPGYDVKYDKKRTAIRTPASGVI